MRALDRKLLRDLLRLWAQALAIAGVIAGGVATLIMALGSHHSFDETRAAYYERYGFADVFAQVRRAPLWLLDDIAKIPGVATAETAIKQLALLDIADFAPPATGQFISVPDDRDPALNRIYLRQGRMPAPNSGDEVVVNEAFAEAHGFASGSRFSAILNGRKRELVIVGTALSPEFVFAVGPGDVMPDNRRFAIVWMPEKALAAAYNLKDAFSSVSVRLMPGASEREVIRQLDGLLERYGGAAAYGRKDQTSHAWLDHELDMLNNMSRTLPPIFMLVAAFLVNLTLSRLVALEREQVGLLKAVGYSNFSIAVHYLKFVILVAVIGIVFGSVLGALLGNFVTRLFSAFFQFPFLVFSYRPSTYVLAAILSLAAAVLGGLRAVHEVVKLAPATAMLPPAPTIFHHVLPDRLSLNRVLPKSIVMMFRGIAHHPIRSILTTLGISFATGILGVSLFITGLMDNLVEVTYFLADRQDATISFFERRSADILNDVARMPGVLAVEGQRTVPVRIRFGSVERRVALNGYPPEADLVRVIDARLQPVALPESGLAISDLLGKILGAGVGDVVEIDLLEGQRRTVQVPIASLVENYFGIRAMMNATTLQALMREGPSVDGVNLTFDPAKTDELYAAIKTMPAVSGLGLQRLSLKNFRELIAVVVTAMGVIYAGLASLISFGVVYNNARIALSERARDLASLRVLGFTRGEVLRILLLELGLLTLLAQPPGWAIGYGLGWFMKTQLATEVMRVRMVMEHSTFAAVSLIIILTAAASALVIRSRVNALDMVAVLKTRD